MKVVFMGTPQFAVTVLSALVESGKHQIAGVVTQPDRPKGRGGKLQSSPVKEYALSQGFAVEQPQKIRDENFLPVLRNWAPEIIVVAAYGQILSSAVLNLPRYGCINVHGSLLPAYRGAAPVQYALLNGDRISGVTVMHMDEGMDTGSILDRVAVPVPCDMTAGELLDVLAHKGAEALLRTMDCMTDKAVEEWKQNEGDVTYAHLLGREMEIIDWNQKAECIHNKIRAFNPVPGAYTILPDGRQIKLWHSSVTEGAGIPGEVILTDKQGFVVACGMGALRVTEVQSEGKKKMPASVFLNGRGLKTGDILRS